MPSSVIRSTARSLAFCLSTAMVAACGGGAPSGVIDTPRVDPSLVGTWKGVINGDGSANSYGNMNATIVFRADSTMTVQGDNPRYCPLNNATWSVSETRFTAAGRDCDNILVNFTAQVPTTTPRLAGTWTASSGRAGTFSLAKQ